MKLDTTPPRGMKDLLPAEVDLRDRATATMNQIARIAGNAKMATNAKIVGSNVAGYVSLT